ncbi:hypothetical protein PDESU_03354 [Pontiella desulfatans]|uniref:Phage shock protein B n=1 Tax=Pontiella desulfatans TaxID=2750659 RepID=A0A6C2U4G0_PONDE|nr:phage shock protein B [Pontiella desulfatans]VGO14785.1 hypothetical protein PDESU_03354 [Pontiella desulfatans]
MDIVGLAAVILLFGTPVIAIICGTLIVIAKRKPQYKDDPEQTKMIQEIHHGLERMERRIEALETILYEPKNKDR